MAIMLYNKGRINAGVVWEKVPWLEAVEKDVNFYDYDGFRLMSYTKNEALALTDLPANTIINVNLVFDGWNWTLPQIKSYINNIGGVVNVGAVYHTTDGKTHITCKPAAATHTAYINLTPTVANAVTVDWGDGTTDTWTSTSAATKSHTYTGITSGSVYDISISCSSGTYRFGTKISGTDSNNQNSLFTNIKISNKVTSFGDDCFIKCSSLQTISIPNSVTTMGRQTFHTCSSLLSVIIPSTVTTIGYGCIQYCSSLMCVSLPNTISSLGNYFFGGCYSLQSVTIPSGVTSLGTYCFQNCYSLRSITIPSSVTSIGTYCFTYCYSLQSITIPHGVTSIANYCFNGCHSLQSITIPSSVTSLGERCLYSGASLRKLYMKPTTPPTLASTNAIPSNANLVIYVPSGSLTNYQTANYWSSFASKIIGYNF